MTVYKRNMAGMVAEFPSVLETSLVSNYASLSSQNAIFGADGESHAKLLQKALLRLLLNPLILNAKLSD